MKRFAVAAAMAGWFAVSAWGAPARAFMRTPGAGDTPVRRPVFAWTAATDATQYLLSITRNGAPYLEKWTRKTTWAPRFDLPEGVYEVRVISFDGVEYGQWSPRIRFRRVFAPALASVNGLSRDGGNVSLVAGSGIQIETNPSNLTVLISSTGITATQLIDLAVTSDKIDNYAITVTKLADGAVSEAKLADGAVTEDKLADGAVTEDKLADGSVTSNKIAAGSVRMSHLDSANASVGQVLKWNGAWYAARVLNGYAEGAVSISPTATGTGAVALGEGNDASGNNAISAGGRFNVIRNNALSSAIVGGEDNIVDVNAKKSIVLAGEYNQVTKDFCIAAGYLASATNKGAVVFADSTSSTAGSWGDDTFTVQASGGVRFESGTSHLANHRVQWKPGDASWQFSSDRNLKEGIRPVDAGEILERVGDLPVASWRFKGHAREHIGVMAQDFHAQFPLAGADPTLLDSADLHGVSLAAIQALTRELKAEQARTAELEARLKALEARLSLNPEP